jgi:hypothetical protein
MAGVMAIGDVVVDPVSKREYVIHWNGSKGSASLVGTDPRYTRQRSDARDHLTRGATMTLDVRPKSVFFKQEV